MIRSTRRAVLTAAVLLPLLPASAATRLTLDADRVLVAVRVDGRPTMAVVDSAAEVTVLDAGFARAIGVRGGAAATARGTGAATTDARLATGVAVDVAGLRLRPPAVALIDLADISRRLGRRIDVIVGRDLFDAGRLALDLAAGTLEVLPPGTRPPGVRLPLTPRRGVEAVPVAIEGIPAIADFDLGNGGTVLVGAAFAARHRLLDDRATATIPGGGIGGEARQTTLTLRSFDLAGHRFADVPVALDASPTAADANIGVRLLRRFGIVTDFAARSIWLEFRG